jgi:hypothetical protein
LLNTVNPAKAGDTKPPVYGIDSYDSGVASRASTVWFGAGNPI